MEELHQVHIYFTGHGVMIDGRTCMVIPHAEEDKEKPWDDRVNIFELQRYIHDELGGKKNLKVLNYFDCCRTTYVKEYKGGEEIVVMAGFAGNIYYLFGCTENSETPVKYDSTSIADQIVKGWGTVMDENSATLSRFVEKFRFARHDYMDEKE
jgi:hypothetical protein